MPGIKVSQEWQDQQRAAKAIRKDISTARAIISDGLMRYKKKCFMPEVKNKSRI